MKHIVPFDKFEINENGIPMQDPQTLSCPACNSVLELDYYKTLPAPRKCVGCGEDIEEVLCRKPWDWA